MLNFEVVLKLIVTISNRFPSLMHPSTVEETAQRLERLVPNYLSLFVQRYL